MGKHFHERAVELQVPRLRSPEFLLIPQLRTHISRAFAREIWGTLYSFALKFGLKTGAPHLWLARMGRSNPGKDLEIDSGCFGWKARLLLARRIPRLLLGRVPFGQRVPSSVFEPLFLLR